MFDIGGSEIVVILLVTLLVMGPKNLPKVARAVGQFMSYARKVTNEFRMAIDDEVRALELEELKAKRAEKGKTNVGVGESIAGPATVAPTAPNLPQPQAVPQENAVPRGADGGAGMQRIDPADEAVLGRPVVDPRSAGAPGERDPDWDGLDDAFDADPASDAEEGGAPSDDGADHDPDEKPGDGS